MNCTELLIKIYSQINETNQFISIKNVWLSTSSKIPNEGAEALKLFFAKCLKSTFSRIYKPSNFAYKAMISIKKSPKQKFRA